MLTAIKQFFSEGNTGIGDLFHRKSHHQTVVLSSDAWGRLNAIRIREGTGSRCEVIRDALRLYEFMSQSSEKGPVCVVVNHGDNTSTSYEVLAKK